jgi:peptidoglycan/xylan/chitin deacetylase (PgdA/CDA1 family)
MTTYPCWVVFYHYVRAAAAADGAGIRPLQLDAFCTQLDWIEQHARVIGFPEFEDAIRTKRGFDAPTALLTFDDGLIDHWEFVFPELQRRGLSGVFFLGGDAFEVPPALANVHRTHLLLDALGAETLMIEVRRVLKQDAAAGRTASADLYRYDGAPEQAVKQLLNYELPIDEADHLLRELFTTHVGDEGQAARRFYLSREQAREMARAGMTLGYHTRRHRVLSRLDRAAQGDELAGGVDLVRALSNQASVPFCYPYGHRLTYDATTIRLLGELGYSCAFNTVRQPVHPDRGARFELPRFDTRDLPPRGTVSIAQERAVCP